jgi:flavin-dependent dehydrogenase
MFSVPGAYFGLTPIEEGKCNLTCLALKHKPFDLLQIRRAHPRLEKLLSTSQPCFEWMKVQVPSFGLKRTPAWKNAYFIGDAAGSVPPASGNGLTLAILGGMRAAEYAQQGRDADFKNDWSRFFRKRLWMGQLLHTALLRPYLLNTFIRAQSPFPQLAQMIYQFSR